MDYCNECNRELTEETPYCEPCMDKQVRDAELYVKEQDEALNRASEECEAKQKAYHLVLDLINDDRLVSNRWEYMAMLPDLLSARDSYIRCVIRHFNEDLLEDHLRTLYRMNEEFYREVQR